MFTLQTIVKCESGLHNKQATYFIQKANEFRSNVWVEVDERRINAKSLLGVLSMAITSGTVVTLIGDGPDERDGQDPGQNAGKGHLLSSIAASIASREHGQARSAKKSAGLLVLPRGKGAWGNDEAGAQGEGPQPPPGSRRVPDARSGRPDHLCRQGEKAQKPRQPVLPGDGGAHGEDA